MVGGSVNLICMWSATLRLIAALLFAVASLTYAQVASADITSGLVAYYPFDGNANDASGNGRNGFVNGPALTADRFGQQNSAYSFDGMDYIETRGMPSLSSYTISAYVKDANLSDEGRIFSNGDWGEVFKGSIDLLVYGASPAILNQTGSSQVEYWSDQVITSDWTHVVATYDDSTHIAKIFINGVEVIGHYQRGNSLPTPNQNPIYNFYIGRNGGGSAIKYFTGSMDDLRIYNRALSGTEVQQLYSLGATVPSQAQTIADSEQDFSLQQGQSGWYYGYYIGSDANFVQMTDTTSAIAAYGFSAWSVPGYWTILA